MKIKEFKKILIIRLSALGDTIHTLPLAYAIKKQYPKIQLDWIVEDKASKFIINNPLIDNVYEIPKKKWKKNKNKLHNLIEYLQIIKKIRKEKYDIVLDTQQLFKSAIILGLSGAKSKISLDGGREFSSIFANEIIKTGRKPFDKNYHVVKRNLEFAKYLGCKDLTPVFVIPDFSNEFSENIKKIMKNLDHGKKTIVLAPATTWYNKHWTQKGWQDLINNLKEKYNILITASEKEKELTNKILRGIDNNGNIYNLSGITTLSDLVYIYKNSDMVISPDSGSAHIAWAVNKPYVITLFFATSPGRTAPYGDKYFSLFPKVECHPCMKRQCRNQKSHLKCIYEISPTEIINIVNNVLQ